MLIGAEGVRLLREYGVGETLAGANAEEAPRNARGKRSTQGVNQYPSKEGLQTVSSLFGQLLRLLLNKYTFLLFVQF